MRCKRLLSLRAMKNPHPRRMGTQTVKKGHGNLPSADCKSKIGDMRGDFRPILLAKSLPYTNEQPGA